jgi:iron complex outermembrane receptor protein
MKKLDIIAVQSLPLALLICVTTPLLAAEGESSNVISLEEITVTAQRRSENLQSVPIAITALTAADITRQGVHDLGSLATQVPGLTFAPFAPSQNIISLRGVSSNDDGPGTDNSVAVFVDDVYMGRVSNINPTMFDVDRVEVLRGPQGTLYGKNTIGGAISVVTSRPDTDSLNVKVSADYGNFNRHDFSALVTGPISSGWAGKLAVVTRDADGSVNNVVLHTKEKNDDDRAVRGQLLRTGDSSTLLLSADFERLHDEDMARIPLGPVTTNLPVNFVAEYQALCGNNYLTCATNPGDGFAYRDSGGVSAKYTDHVTSSSDFISITAVRRNYDSSSMDSLGAPWAGLGALMNYVDDATNQYSEELRWVSSFNRLQYVAGLWAMREDTDRLRVFILPSLSPLFADNDSYRGINRTLSYAGFGQADWHFADQWTLTFGGRYSYDHKHIDNNSVHGPDGVLGIIPVTFSNEREASWSKFTPKISISYQPTTALNLYATAVEGFKSGGFAASPVSIADTNPLLPEQAINIEGGAKLEISSRFRANLAIFDTNYKNLQIQSFGPPANCVPGPGVSCAGQFETFNAPGAYAKGAELEVSWLPINGLTLNASFGYLDARFKGVVLPNADFPNQSGQDMIRSPRQKENVEAIYQWSGFGGQFAASGDYSFTASQRGELEPYAVQPKYDLVNGRLSWSSPQHWDIALWGKNLADKAWVSHVYTIGGEVFGVFGDPRTYGVTVNWHLK